MLVLPHTYWATLCKPLLSLCLNLFHLIIAAPTLKGNVKNESGVYIYIMYRVVIIKARVLNKRKIKTSIAISVELLAIIFFKAAY